MITDRPLTVDDKPMLQAALDQNTFHPGGKAEWFYGKKKFSVVYVDEQGPIGVLRYTKTLRLVAVWCDNDDHSRNGAAIMQGMKDAVKAAQDDGFTEIIFQTNSPLLANFCTNMLGFEESPGEYRKDI
jgi:hypothetical protein